MNPLAFFALTFGVWVILKGQAKDYWALATTHNVASGASQGTTATPSVVPSTSTLGAKASVPSVPSVPNLIGNSIGSKV